jgi:hypothetical protein
MYRKQKKREKGKTPPLMMQDRPNPSDPPRLDDKE